METKPLPVVGSPIRVRSQGTTIEGKVLGISEKDGKPIIDYWGPCVLSIGKLSEPTTRWCWLDQIVIAKVDYVDYNGKKLQSDPS